MEPVAASEGKQLHQAGRLPQAPSILLNFSVGPYGNLEPTEQPNTYGHRCSALVLRRRMVELRGSGGRHLSRLLARLYLPPRKRSPWLCLLPPRGGVGFIAVCSLVRLATLCVSVCVSVCVWTIP